MVQALPIVLPIVLPLPQPANSKTSKTRACARERGKRGCVELRATALSCRERSEVPHRGWETTRQKRVWWWESQRRRRRRVRARVYEHTFNLQPSTALPVGPHARKSLIIKPRMTSLVRGLSKTNPPHASHVS